MGFSSSHFVIILVSVLLLIILTLALYALEFEIKNNIYAVNFIAIIGFYGAVRISIYTVHFMMEGTSVKYLMVINLPIITSTIYALYMLNQGVMHRIIAMAVAPLIICIILDFIIKSDLKVNAKAIKNEVIMSLLLNAMRLLPHSVSGSYALLIERFVINYFIGLSALGSYYLVFIFAQINDMLLSAIWRTIAPYYYQAAENKDKNEKRILLFYATITIMCSVILIYVIPVLYKFLVDESFHQDLNILPMLIIGFGFFNIASSLSNYLITRKKSIALSVASICNMLISTLILIYVYSILGDDGIGIGFMLQNLSFLVINIILIQVVSNEK